MKKIYISLIVFVMLICGCSHNEQNIEDIEGIQISLSDKTITLDGKELSEDKTQAVYLAHDIVYYESGKDFTYGEGEKQDEHEQSEANKHSVVHISQPGTYILSGKLSYGQIAIDLGEDAKDDPNAIVNLVFNNVDITCTVAPAVIFYNVYECSSKDEDTATKDVDTKNAGANVVIADGTKNNINGSYVAKIYKSVELSEDGKEVIDSKKLHKYDGAFYSKQSLNIYGGQKGNGVLNINAENEGLDSELHLTINGGMINIVSGNDGINTNEDNVSVTTINGGMLNIICDGSTNEGDGIDSNGWLVVNGGTVISQACSTSGDAGIDSDNGIYINGGSVMATGNMLDHIAGGNQTYVVLSFNNRQNGNSTYTLKNEKGNVVGEYSPTNEFTYLIIAGDELVEGDYTLWQDETQLNVMISNMNGGRPQGNTGNFPQKPQGNERPDKPIDDKRPDDFKGERPNKPKGDFPQNGEFPFDQMPENFEGMGPGFMGGNMNINGETSTTLTIKKGANQYIVISNK